jgi:hypothetical protein
MAKQIFSKEYAEYCEKLKQATFKRNDNPSKENVDNFERLSTQNWSPEQRFTPEYLSEYLKENQTRELTFEEEFDWLIRSTTIDDKANSGLISEERRAYLHTKNDYEYESKKNVKRK